MKIIIDEDSKLMKVEPRAFLPMTCDCDAARSKTVVQWWEADLKSGKPVLIMLQVCELCHNVNGAPYNNIEKILNEGTPSSRSALFKFFEERRFPDDTKSEPFNV